MTILIKDNDYLKCDNASKNMWSSWKPARTTRENDPFYVERIGRLGELAVSIALGATLALSPDFNYRENGDNGDLRLSNISIDVKTACKPITAGLVRVQNARGEPVPFTSNYYVFAHVATEDRASQTATIIIDGWQSAQYLQTLEHVPARLGKHKNVEVCLFEMKPIQELRNALEAYQTELLNFYYWEESRLADNSMEGYYG